MVVPATAIQVRCRNVKGNDENLSVVGIRHSPRMFLCLFDKRPGDARVAGLRDLHLYGYMGLLPGAVVLSHKHMHTHMHMHINAQKHTQTHIPTNTYTHARTYTHQDTHKYTHAHTNIYTHARTHTNTSEVHTDRFRDSSKY